MIIDARFPFRMIRDELTVTQLVVLIFCHLMLVLALLAFLQMGGK